MTQSLQVPYEITEKDGCTYFYDEPRYSVFTGKISITLLVFLFVGYQFPVYGMFFDGLQLPFDALFIALLFFANFFIIFRLATLKTWQVRWWDTAFTPILGYWFVVFGLALLHVAASAMRDWFFVGFLLEWAFYIAVAITAFVFIFTPAQSYANISRVSTKTLPRAVVSTARLKALLHDAQAARNELSTLTVFDPKTAALAGAWESKDNDTIEALLNAGNQQTLASWRGALAIFNAARERTDTARSRLRYLFNEAKSELARHGLMDDIPDQVFSGILDGRWEKSKADTDKFRNANRHNVRMVGRTGAQAMSGQSSWQVLLLFIAMAILMHFINKQRMLRQLKEYEGQLEVQASDVLGDIAIIRADLDTRMLPQFEGLIEIIQLFEQQLDAYWEAQGGTLNVVPSREQVAELARMYLIAKQLLEMKAGN